MATPASDPDSVAQTTLRRQRFRLAIICSVLSALAIWQWFERRQYERDVTLLLACGETGHKQDVSSALEAGGNPNFVGPDKWSPVRMACSSLTWVQREKLELLLDAGADVKSKRARALGSVFHSGWADHHGGRVTYEMLEILLDAGAPVDSRAAWICKAIVQTNENWVFQKKTVELLLEAGADPDQLDHNEETALSRALHRPSLVEILLEADADPNLGDFRPLGILATTHPEIDEGLLNNTLKSAKLLVEGGAEVDYVINEGWHVGDLKTYTPVTLASYHDSLPMARFLLEHGADPNMPNREGARAIDYAKSPEMRALLTEFGALDAPGDAD